MSSSIQFFHKIDLTDPKAHFVERLGSTKPPLLQSHGWLDGALANGTLEQAMQGYNPSDESTWPVVVPRQDIIFVDRYHKKVVPQPVRVPLERLRPPATQQPELSVVFIRWGGGHRIGEDTSEESLATDGGWGVYGAPPSDWYMDAVVNKGVLQYPGLSNAIPGGPSCEVLSLFLSCTDDMKRLATDASSFTSGLRGVKQASFWMLWPADWDADWEEEGYEAYVERRILFASMRGLEAAGVRSSFPHPGDLYEHITSKAWMATVCQEPKARLPSAVLVDRQAIMKDPAKEATDALKRLEAIRQTSVFSDSGGPSVVNKEVLKKGAVKIGWSWEAKYVWFFNSPNELASCLYEMIRLPGCLSDTCIVQEWVDFDFEVRLFFFPSRDWAPPAILHPKHYEYTSWSTGAGARKPGSFTKPGRPEVLERWDGDATALDLAHAQAEEAAQFLIARLLTVHPVPIPMIRLDFMCKRLGPGQVQVAFGEYCECGACCLQWNEGPPTVWKACLDYALN